MPNNLTEELPKEVYEAIKKAEPLDCWEAYEEVWKNLQPWLSSKKQAWKNEGARETIEKVVEECEKSKLEEDWKKIETGDYDAASKIHIADKNILYNQGLKLAVSILKKQFNLEEK